MATKKKAGQSKKYCRIFLYIQDDLDSAFAGAISHLCLEGALSPGRRAPGITFLYPDDAAFRSEIIDKAYSMDADAALKLINSLIIPDIVRTGEEFRKRDIGSLAGVKLEPKAVDGNRVTLKSGAVIEPDPGFFTLENRDNIAVWRLVSGRPPLEGEAYKAPRKGMKTGGNDANQRQALARAVEQDFDVCMRENRCRTRFPYLAKAVSLLNFLKAQQPALFAAVLPMIDPNPAVTFYLLVEPYKTVGGDYVIGDEVLFGPNGWKGAEVFGDAVSEYLGFFAPNPSGPLASKDYPQVMAMADTLRQQITGDASQINKISTPKKVRDAYEKLASSNSIAGLAPIFDKSTLAILPGTKKLWQDEFRHVIHAQFEYILALPDYNAPGAMGRSMGTNELAQLVDLLRLTWPGNNYSDEAGLASLKELQTLAVPTDMFLALMRFINSSDFLYVPPTGSGGAASTSFPLGMAEPYSRKAYMNRSQAALEGLRRWSAMVNPMGIDPSAVQAVLTYAKMHGGLPPALQAFATK